VIKKDSIKVGLVTTWNERCGVATYAKNLVNSLPEIDWRIIWRDEWGSGFNNVPIIGKDCDIVHWNHQGGLFAGLAPSVVAQSCHKTLITRQCIGPEELFGAATIRVSHIPRLDYVHIPHGIVKVDNLPFTRLGGEEHSVVIGTAGIPFSGKGHVELVEIAGRIPGSAVNMVIPENPHARNTDMIKHCQDLASSLGVAFYCEDQWLDESDVSRILNKSDVNVFYYTRPANGISGAVRMGLAALRPVIVSDHSQFQDLNDYVHVAKTLEEAVKWITQFMRGTASLPNQTKLVEDWRWGEIGQRYLQLYQKLIS